VFSLAAVLAGIGGMLYSPQMGIITPANMGVAESIMMVIWVAVGGRGTLSGAIVGALVVNYMYNILTTQAPSSWPFVQGALFIGVVLFFPDGLTGLWSRFFPDGGTKQDATLPPDDVKPEKVSAPATPLIKAQEAKA
jgi:urea transport system permease protein